MRLLEALARRTDDEQTKLTDHLRAMQDSGIRQQAVHNLHAETRLSETTWGCLFDTLLSCNSDAHQLAKQITECFQNFTLSGPEISFPELTDLYFGRVIDMDVFSELYRRHCRVSKRVALKRIRAYMHRSTSNAPDTLKQIQRRWRNLPLGRYLIWSTFDPKNAAEPFQGLPGSASKLRCLLGLKEELTSKRKQPVIVLTYRLPTDVTPRIPTVSDAYAGPAWNYYFRPAPDGEAFGRTLPRPECAEKTRGLPECVHQIITGADLAKPPIEVL